MRAKSVDPGLWRDGHAMEYLLADRHDVRIWNLGKVVKGRHATLEEEVAEAQVVLFCLPVNPHHEIASRIEPYLAQGSLCLSIAKGLDESGRMAAQVFDEVFNGRHHYGVVYGPMISEELRAGRQGFADAVLSDAADFEVMHSLFRGTTLMCQQGERHARQELVG